MEVASGVAAVGRDGVGGRTPGTTELIPVSKKIDQALRGAWKPALHLHIVHV